MTPAEQGRHCAVCDNVVRDFRGMDRSHIIHQLKSGDENACGRLDRAMVMEPLDVVALYRFPAQGLRLFVLAFVLTFGLRACGIEQAMAQSLQPAIDSLQHPTQLKSILYKIDTNAVFLVGHVLDVYTREPIEFAHVAANDGDKFLAGTLSDADGRFELHFPKALVKDGSYQLKLRYQGREREDRDMKVVIQEMVYLIDGSEMIKGITLEGNARNTDWFGHLTGAIVSRTICNIGRGTNIHGFGESKSIDRPLDEWLMMNFSEIHHSGRW